MVQRNGHPALTRKTLVRFQVSLLHDVDRRAETGLQIRSFRFDSGRRLCRGGRSLVSADASDASGRRTATYDSAVGPDGEGAGSYPVVEGSTPSTAMLAPPLLRGVRGTDLDGEGPVCQSGMGRVRLPRTALFIHGMWRSWSARASGRRQAAGPAHAVTIAIGIGGRADQLPYRAISAVVPGTP